MAGHVTRHRSSPNADGGWSFRPRYQPEATRPVFSRQTAAQKATLDEAVPSLSGEVGVSATTVAALWRSGHTTDNLSHRRRARQSPAMEKPRRFEPGHLAAGLSPSSRDDESTSIGRVPPATTRSSFRTGSSGHKRHSASDRTPRSEMDYALYFARSRQSACRRLRRLLVIVATRDNLGWPCGLPVTGHGSPTGRRLTRKESSACTRR